MISGRQTLQDVQREYREERERLQDIGRRLQKANERMIAIEAARADQLARLARIRAGEPDASPATPTVVDERVKAMLEQRQQMRADLEARLRQLDEAEARVESDRQLLIEAAEAASARLDAAEAETQERLQQDEAYRAQLEQARAAELTARFAAEKATQSEEERAAKGRAYERDPLFMYLWKRHYGTREYRAWGLTRWLDRKIARLAAFDQARANYARLTELPIRLREHADAMTAAADAELTELRRLDEEARAADGLAELEQERDAAAAALERHDSSTLEGVTARQDLSERLAQLDRGDDEAYQDMLVFLAAELNRADLQELRREALATPIPQDDIIVTELLELEAEVERIAATVRDLGETSAGSRKRLHELEEFLQRFTQQQYDAPGSGFPDGDLVSTTLKQFLGGAITSAVLWRILESQRRGPARRSDSSFGSGGFGRGSPWSGGNWPRSARGGREGVGGGGGGRRTQPAARSGGSMKRGGFKTGGSMKRGGFKTGGRKR